MSFPAFMTDILREYKLTGKKLVSFFKKHNSYYLLHAYNVPDPVISTLYTSHLTKFS